VDKFVLNLGCGTEDYGTHRVDIEQTRSATHVFNVENGILFPDGMFDAVYERNLLEHLQDHGYHLRELYRVLKKGGVVTLITDNAACVRFYLFRTHMGGYMGHRKFLSHNADKHYAVFTVEHLKNLFLSARFQIIRSEYVDTDFMPTFFLDRAMRMLHIFASLTYPRIKVVAIKE